MNNTRRTLLFAACMGGLLMSTGCVVRARPVHHAVVYDPAPVVYDPAPVVCDPDPAVVIYDRPRRVRSRVVYAPRHRRVWRDRRVRRRHHVRRRHRVRHIPHAPRRVRHAPRRVRHAPRRVRRSPRARVRVDFR